MHKNAIFMCFDDAYIKYAKACIRSIKSNYAKHPELLVLYFGKDFSTIEWLRNIDGLTLLDQQKYRIDMSYFPDGPVKNNIVYQRYILWSNLFDDYEKILYLDVDTLVLASLDKVFEHNNFFCVSNHSSFDYLRIFKTEFDHNKKLLNLLAEDGICNYPNGISDMINAGVFLIDKACRNEKSLTELFYITTKYGEYIRYADQSVISLWMLMNNISPSIDFGFNFQVSHFVNPLVKVDLEDICILHFIYHKPFTKEFCQWDPLLKNYAGHLEKLYARYYYD